MGIWKLLLLSIVAVSIPRTSSANLVWTNTFDDGVYDDTYRQYQSHQCSSHSDYIDRSLYNFVTSPVRAGRLAMQHQLRNCDERSEIGVPHGVLKADEEYWLGWSYFVPDNFLQPVPGESERSIVQQMVYQASFIDQRDGTTLFECNGRAKRQGILINRGVPGSYMTIAPSGDAYNYTIAFYRGQDSAGRYLFGCKSFSLPLQLNRWSDFVMNVRPSSDPEQGFVRIWLNGTLYVDERVALIRPGVNAMGAWKIGVYVGNPGHGERLIYTDELRVGNADSSFAEVSPDNNKQ